MADYLHGAYGTINNAGSKYADDAQSAFVYIGTAPVHKIAGGSANVNKPVLVRSIAEAKAKFGYSEDFANYTLCEAMKAHFIDNAVGPLILINVLDPATHCSTSATSTTVTAADGKAVVSVSGEPCIDSVTVTASSTSLVIGTDISAALNENGQIVLTEIISGKIANKSLTVGYKTVDPSKVTSTAVIGTTDGVGKHTGLYAVRNVYPITGYIPAYILAPGFSSVPAVHTAMCAVSKKINSHWDAYILADLPIVDADGDAIEMDDAAAWKSDNGYNKSNETVYYPMAEGTDGKKYHLSVLAAANLQQMLFEQDGIPYRSASNTEVTIVKNLYIGESDAGSVYDDEVINEYLCKNGIASAAFVGGRWVIWGAHSAAYSASANSDALSVSETGEMMMYYISNDFQNRRTGDVDKPMTANDLQTIVSEEQARLDALVKIGALTYGEVVLDASRISESDIANGDYTFSFNITTTPLAKSLTAVVTWTDEGFTTYYEAMIN